MPTFHPAYLLRNPASKKEAWIDFQAIRDAYREVLAERERSGESLHRSGNHLRFRGSPVDLGEGGGDGAGDPLRVCPLDGVQVKDHLQAAGGFSVTAARDEST